MKKVYFMMLLVDLLFIQPKWVTAQVDNTTYEPMSKTLFITLDDDPKVIDGIEVKAGNIIRCPLVYYKDETTSQRVFLYCDVKVTGQTISLGNFRTMPTAVTGDRPDDLIIGAIPTSADFPKIPDSKNRKYFVQFESVLIDKQEEPIPIRISLKLGSKLAQPPTLSVRIIKNERDKLLISPEGITVAELLAVLNNKPGLIKVVYDFSDKDPALDLTTSATSIVQDPKSPDRVVIILAKSLPHRVEDYSAIVKIPWENLRGKVNLTDDWAIPPRKKSEEDFLSGGIRVLKSLDKLPQRSNSEFSFESAFTSIVKPSIGKRNNVGVFGLYFKPTIKTFSFGAGRGEKNPSWVSLRPLFEADVDTQLIKDSKSPNRVQFGFDVEYGKVLGYDVDETGKLNQTGFFRHYVWTNGLRYDSDRDFKLQTMYWHTEFVPIFRNFEQNFSRRLYQFKNTKDKEDARKEPVVSSYYVRPSFGYELGGTIRRDARDLTTPTKNISRAFFRLGMSLELKRLIKFSVDDTYYYLQNASRRKNRNYIETILEFNLGRLSKFDLNGYSNSIFLKFQGGEQPPDFGRVNSFSIGFKIFK